MPLSNWTKFWITELLTFCYLLTILIVALLNTATWLTERPHENWYHEPGLYAMVKGFNVFFGITVLVVIVLIAYHIGDHILMIPDLKVRARLNLLLFATSAWFVVAIPSCYMAFRHLRIFTLAPYWNSLYLLTLSTFLALNAFILWLLAIFLLLTSIMGTLRSYNIFKFLVKLRGEHRLPPPPAKSAMRQGDKRPAPVQKLAPGQPLPTIIGKVPRKYQKHYQHIQQQPPQIAHSRPMGIGPYRIGTARPMTNRPRFGSRTPSTSHQSIAFTSAGSSLTSSPRIIFMGQNPHSYYPRRPTPPSLRLQQQLQQQQRQQHFNV